jgi:hypothetical protein
MEGKDKLASFVLRPGAGNDDPLGVGDVDVVQVRVSLVISVRYWMTASRSSPSSTSACERTRASRSRWRKNRSMSAPARKDFSSRLTLRVSRSMAEVLRDEST